MALKLLMAVIATIFSILFASNTDYRAYYLKGHNLSKKLNIQLNDNSGYDEFRFIGWIK